MRLLLGIAVVLLTNLGQFLIAFIKKSRGGDTSASPNDEPGA